MIKRWKQGVDANASKDGWLYNKNIEINNEKYFCSFSVVWQKISDRVSKINKLLN